MRKHILPILFAVLFLFSAALPVFAEETGSVTVLYMHEEEPVTGVEFRIYKAAEWDGQRYVLSPPFDGYGITVSDEPDGEEWGALAETLASYAARDGIVPLDSDVTDEDGRVVFDSLERGLYLIVGDRLETEEYTLTPQAMLVGVPHTNMLGEEEFDVAAEPKYEYVLPERVDRRAIKIWKDDGEGEDRPKSVTVQLLRDGEVYDEVTLSAENNWEYTWHGLNAKYDWRVVEKEVPDGYTVSVDLDGITFTVTNKGKNPPPPPSTLPQTGMLWWPVPVLFVGGFLTLMIGVVLTVRKKGGSRE